MPIFDNAALLASYNESKQMKIQENFINHVLPIIEAKRDEITQGIASGNVEFPIFSYNETVLKTDGSRIVTGKKVATLAYQYETKMPCGTPMRKGLNLDLLGMALGPHFRIVKKSGVLWDIPIFNVCEVNLVAIFCTEPVIRSQQQTALWPYDISINSAGVCWKPLWSQEAAKPAAPVEAEVQRARSMSYETADYETVDYDTADYDSERDGGAYW